MFEDLMYPDNQERALRAAELAQDCSMFVYDLAQSKEEIDMLIKQSNEIIGKAYKDIAMKDINYTPIDLSNENKWIAQVSLASIGIFVYRQSSIAIEILAKSWLLRQGRIGEAGLVNLVGLPKWLNIGKIAGSTAASIIATLGVEAILDAVVGSERRSALQNAIHDLQKPRIELKRSCLINEEIKNSLRVCSSTYSVLLNTYKIMGKLTKENLDLIAGNVVEEHKANVNQITEEYTKSMLSNLDKSRKSWTNEDN